MERTSTSLGAFRLLRAVFMAGLLSAVFIFPAGCVNLPAHDATPGTGEQWKPATLVKETKSMTGKTDCSYKLASGVTYTVNARKSCLAAIEVDVNSYVFRANPLFFSEHFNYRPAMP
jgi:hypothetical protein